MNKTANHQHRFVKFISLRGDGDMSLGFECGTSAKQVMPDANDQRIVTATCCNCGHTVTFDAGRFRWRLWLLPKRPFTVAPKRRPLFLSEWDAQSSTDQSSNNQISE